MGLITVVQPSLSDQAALDYYRSINEGAVAGNTKSQTNQAGGGGGSGTVQFFSDWRTVAHGSTSDSAIRDNNKWLGLSGNTPTGTVTIENAPAGMGFPTAKVWYQRLVNGSTGKQATLTTAPGVPGLLPALQVGHTRSYRWYYAHLLGANETLWTDYQNHPFQDNGSIGASTWTVQFMNRHPTQPNVILNTPINRYDARLDQISYYFGASGLVDDADERVHFEFAHAYRWELQIKKLSSTTMWQNWWVFDNTGAQMIQTTEIHSFNGSAALGLEEEIEFSGTDNDLTNLVFGWEGLQAPHAETNHDLGCMAGIIVVDDAPEHEPLGPYGTFDEEELP